MDWTFKTCRTSADGTTAEWLVFKLRYRTARAAAWAAGCYMLQEAAQGHMVITSLEPIEPDPTADYASQLTDEQLDKRGFGV